VPEVKPRPVSGPACRGAKRPWASPKPSAAPRNGRGRQAGTDLQPPSGRSAWATWEILAGAVTLAVVVGGFDVSRAVAAGFAAAWARPLALGDGHDDNALWVAGEAPGRGAMPICCSAGAQAWPPARTRCCRRLGCA